MNWFILMVALAQLDAPNAAEAVRERAEGVRTTGVVKVPDPFDAAAWVAEDALALKARNQSAEGCLYVWIGPENDPNIAKVNSLAVNSGLSHASTIVIPELTAGGRLIRWDLHALAPDPADFKRLVGIVNSLAKGEPFWHFDRAALGLPAVKCDPFLWIDGTTYSQTFFDLHPATEAAYRIAQRETGLHTPLVRADYFLRKISSTIQGGLYYHGRGFVVHGKRLNETEIFATIGVSVELSRRVGGDDRVGIVRSGVTGQARAIEFIQGAIGPVRMSYDRSSDNEKIEAHPFYNLLSVVDRADGKETIFTLKNDLFGYIATDGRGNLVDEVPATIATNHRTPAPHPARLEIIGCIECHANDGGVRFTPNDVARLLKNPKDLDAFADFSGTGITKKDIDRLAGLYGGDFERRARDARNIYADAVFKATRGMTAKDAGNEWARQFHSYWHDAVDSQRQLLDLGWKARSPQAANQKLETLLRKQENDLLIFGKPGALEDPLRPAPRLGVPIRRQDAERIQPESWRRAFNHRNQSLEVSP